MPDKMTDNIETPGVDTLPVLVDATPAPRVLDELLVGQVFLVQATIESASALGAGLQDVRKALYGDGEMGAVLKRTGRAVFQPYRERVQLFRQLPRRQD